MELRKDPITQSWVIQVESEDIWPEAEVCPLCPGREALYSQAIYAQPEGKLQWQVCVIPHFRPLYRIEGDTQRSAEGIYDRMCNLVLWFINTVTKIFHACASCGERYFF